MPELAGAVAAQYAAAVRLGGAVEAAYQDQAERVRKQLRRGSVLAGDARTRWRGYPRDSSADELLDALVESLAALVQCAVAAAEERVRDAWRREPAAGALGAHPGPSGSAASDREAGERIGIAVRRWRRVLEELVEDELRTTDRTTPARTVAPDADTVVALLAAALLGGRRTRAAGERLAELLGAQTALRLRDKGGELVVAYVDGALNAERDLRIAPLEALDVTPEPQAALIAALSVLQKEK